MKSTQSSEAEGTPLLPASNHHKIKKRSRARRRKMTRVKLTGQHLYSQAVNVRTQTDQLHCRSPYDSNGAPSDNALAPMNVPTEPGAVRQDAYCDRGGRRYSPSGDEAAKKAEAGSKKVSDDGDYTFHEDRSSDQDKRRYGEKTTGGYARSARQQDQPIQQAQLPQGRGMKPLYKGTWNYGYGCTAQKGTVQHYGIIPTARYCQWLVGQPPIQQHYEQNYDDGTESIVPNSAAYWEDYYAARRDMIMSYAEWRDQEDEQLMVDVEESEFFDDRGFIPPKHGILTDRGENNIFTPRNEFGIAPSTEPELNHSYFPERKVVLRQPSRGLIAASRQQTRQEYEGETTVGATQYAISPQFQANMNAALAGQTSHNAIQPKINHASVTSVLASSSYHPTCSASNIDAAYTQSGPETYPDGQTFQHDAKDPIAHSIPPASTHDPVRVSPLLAGPTNPYFRILSLISSAFV